MDDIRFARFTREEWAEEDWHNWPPEGYVVWAVGPASVPVLRKRCSSEWGHRFEDPLQRYRYGQCFALALAIHLMTGWPMVALDNGDHVVNRTPGGLLFDVGGVWYDEDDAPWPWSVEKEVDTFWLAEQVKDDFYSYPCLDRATLEEAALLVSEVLSNES